MSRCDARSARCTDTSASGMSARTAAPRAGSRQTSATVAPMRPSASAVTRPIPDVAPVTTQTRPRIDASAVRHLVRERRDRVEQTGHVEDVVVVRTGSPEEALRLVRPGEETLAELERHDLVLVAVRDE